MLLPMHAFEMSVYIAGFDILLADRALCPLSPLPEEDGHPGRSQQGLVITSVVWYGSRPIVDFTAS